MDIVRTVAAEGMAPPVLSLAASEIDPATLSGVLADYLAYEQARIFRRLLLKRLAGLAIVASAVAVWAGLAYRPPFWIVLGLLVAAGAQAEALALKARARIARQLTEIEARQLQAGTPDRSDPSKT